MAAVVREGRGGKGGKGKGDIDVIPSQKSMTNILNDKRT